MSHLNPIGVDLAKNIIQVSAGSARGKELLNKALTRRKFAEFLGQQKVSLVAFEACATAHYWARAAQRHGHAVKILGLTPKQYSSGGKANIVGISKKVANKRLRSVLIQGAKA